MIRLLSLEKEETDIKNMEENEREKKEERKQKKRTRFKELAR